MSWPVCALLAVVMIAFGVRVFLSKKNNLSRSVFVLGCLFVATYIAYIPPFLSTYGMLPGLVGNLVHVLRVITLDADITQFYDTITAGIQNGVLIKVYIAILGVVHVALPAISALTAVTVLFRFFSSVQLYSANKRNRPMFVFSEVNERSLHLAKSLEQVHCDIVFANSAAGASSEIKSKHGVIFKEEGILELGIQSKKKKNIYFFCISEDEDLSLSHTLQLIEKFAAIPEAQQEYIHIYNFSKHQDFAVFVDSADKKLLDVQCINEYEMQIYNLLDKYPLMKVAKSGIHVLLHGLSPINVVALRAIAWCGQLSGFSLRVSAVGINIQEQIEDLKLKTPGLFTQRYDIRFYDCKHEKEIVDTITRECADANYIIVSEETDNLTMERGILLRRLFYKLDPQFVACPQIFCYINEPAKHHLVKQLATAEANPKRKMNYTLVPFGCLDEIYTYEFLVDSRLEKLAKNVHLAYEEIFSDGDIDVKEALKRYNIFEVNKRSNRANALHIRYKLNMLGLDYTDAQDAEAVHLEDYFTGEMLDRMAYSEHDRWMAFLETEGWIPATREEVLTYRESGISKGRHNCPILKMHPYICEYEKLKDLSLELEGKDTTVYDAELIVRIPDILGDKWHVSGKEYKIIKLK